MNPDDPLVILRKRAAELHTASVTLQARLHEVSQLIDAIERASGTRPRTGRSRKVLVFGVPQPPSDDDTPEPPDAA
jgi:hypothetical protein